MTRRTAVTPTCWGIFREVEHSPGREADDAGILEATGRRLEEAGAEFVVAYRTPATLTGRESTLPSLAFSMCESLAALEHLRTWERRGVCVINRSRSIGNTHRERTIPLLEGRRVPMPESRLLDCGRPLPRGKQEDRLFSACWVKQATEHKTREGDVIFATGPTSVRDALDRLRSRGLQSAVVQRHVDGDLLKFYGVTDAAATAGDEAPSAAWFKWFYPREHPPSGHVFDTRTLCDIALGAAAAVGDEAPSAAWFKWFYPREHPPSGHVFDTRTLCDIAAGAALALGLDVWGGDAIVTPAGEIFVIDLNAWPSFALFREEAADHIAAHLAARLRRVASVAV